MNKSNSFVIVVLVTLLTLNLWGCVPEIGSEKWCANVKEKPSADWSMSEAANYAKHCIIK